MDQRAAGNEAGNYQTQNSGKVGPKKVKVSVVSLKNISLASLGLGGTRIRGVTWKSGPGVKSSIFSANIGPTETYYIPNQWKLNKAFAELCRFEIAALIE